ncbi:class II aldolase/adducin family protein [Kitasatospora viridis]|uniref:Ribulose-5-phosphate 4-epimerase/fuculose-1-phosphate aldolase n=1 Tax=Kitasatospora viridis TaxID=281105 RepID=A0A561UBW6_9ACTN|nr:class II aldolase/adducin family protein [Kitasatospora viridis]TWF96850.1 ribulose-5-phosphate 4-epimerase/fuculose-1-phosphate aldolase [Kitasatospora viridis]
MDPNVAKLIGPTPEGVTFPLPPTFDSFEEERQHRKEQLAAAFRLFGRLGFSEGVAGHITVRDPEFPDCYWVNPFGMAFSLIKASDLLLVDHEGTLLVGRRLVNKAAFVIHSAVHAARPDVVAAAHAHSLHGKAFASLGIPLDPITQDACAFYQDHGLYLDYRGVADEVEEGKRIGVALGAHKAAILANHGLLTVGQTVAEAAWWFVTMERSCQAQLLAMAAGTPRLIDHETAERTHAQLGGSLAGWFQAQPLFDQVFAASPDLVD